jgi:hypothetical protein
VRQAPSDGSSSVSSSTSRIAPRNAAFQSSFERFARVIQTFYPIFAATACLCLFSWILYRIVVSTATLNSASSFIWCAVGLSIPLVGTIKFFLLFIDRLRRDVDDSNDASVCSVEVCINNETVLTVRSWWPTRMTHNEVERHGVRVAMSSARRWLNENSQPGGKVSRVKFSEEVATDICRDYICERTEGCTHSSEHQCSVCLEDIEPEHGCLRMKKCGHIFHLDCLSNWVAQSSKLSCLLCREDHCDLVPQSIIAENVIKEEPSISVLTVAIEHGSLIAEGAS